MAGESRKEEQKKGLKGKSGCTQEKKTLALDHAATKRKGLSSLKQFPSPFSPFFFLCILRYNLFTIPVARFFQVHSLIVDYIPPTFLHHGISTPGRATTSPLSGCEKCKAFSHDCIAQQQQQQQWHNISTYTSFYNPLSLC